MKPLIDVEKLRRIAAELIEMGNGLMDAVDVLDVGIPEPVLVTNDCVYLARAIEGEGRRCLATSATNLDCGSATLR